MSHRVTTKTRINDKELAIQALKLAGMSYREEGTSVIRITSGSMREATLDLRTGTITGDSDYHRQDTLGALRRHYSEAEIRQRCLLEGHSIESCQTEQGQGETLTRMIVTGSFAMSG